MKQPFIYLLVVLVVFGLRGSFAQKKPTVERRVHDTYIEEITFTSRHQDVAVVRTFTPEGQRITEEHFANYDQGIKHGLTRCWYANGQTYWSCDYKNGDLHGPLLVYYPDGSPKRREYYKLGLSRERRCFTPEGQPEECEAFSKSASFNGTNAELVSALKNELKQAGLRQTNQDRYVAFQGIVEENGFLTNVKVMTTDTELADQVKTAVSRIQRWKPASVDNMAVPGHYYLSMVIRGQDIYINR